MSERSAVEAIEEVYRRIAAHADNPVFIHLIEKGKVLERVDELGRGPINLPLLGRIFAVKDNMDVAGLPTTAACPAYAYTPAKTATIVSRLLAAGAILVGKTNLDQFATGLVGTRSPYGACRNSVDPEYISGGSSSGSALAVALGMAHFSLGTDTAGSGRVPAAFNGLVGLKPTRGLVSTAGLVPACRSIDCPSIFARSVADAVKVLSVIEGFDGADPYSRTGPPATFNPRSFGLAVPKQLEFFGDDGYARLFEQAVARLVKQGARPVEVDFEPFLAVQEILYGPWVAERTALFEPYLDDMLPVTRQIIASGKQYSAADLFRTQHRLAALRRECQDAWGTADAMVVPGAPTIYKIAEVEADPITLNSRLGRYTNFVNLLDLAAITVPAGARDDGLPFGITLIGPAFSDRTLAAVASDFHALPP